jgi:hypothetical protein
MLRFDRLMTGLMCSLCLFAGSGCAVQYFDPETGTEHLWGIGHMRMKVGQANEGVRAVVTGTDTLGLSAGSVASEWRITLGWERLSQFRVLDTDTSVRLEWPSSDLFSVRVGSTFPADFKSSKDIRNKD